MQIIVESFAFSCKYKGFSGGQAKSSCREILRFPHLTVPNGQTYENLKLEEALMKKIMVNYFPFT